MKPSEACIIFKNIDSPNIGDVRKAIAILEVLSMPTHQSVTKAAILKVIKWLCDRYALDLVIHQRAEIERLCEEAICYKDLWYKAEENAHNAKSEAIKEFAEKTHKMVTEIYHKHIFGNYDLEDEEKEAIMDFSLDITSGFDDLVKEMGVLYCDGDSLEE
jgi:hypothetical protein